MTEAQFVTFGCGLNTYESEVMRDHAARARLKNAIIFNTCAVTPEASHQAKLAIRQAHSKQPQAKIIVTGCAAQTTPELFADMPEVSLVLGNEEKLQAGAWAKGANQRINVGNVMLPRASHSDMIEKLNQRTRAFIQIQNGCDHGCTFCVIPFGRANSRSMPIAKVIERVKRCVGSGHSEVILSGVNLTSWGHDLADQPKLGTMITKILTDVPDLKRLRLSSIDPCEADVELRAIWGEDKRLMPHIHLALQSGDDTILSRMNRRHSRAQAVAFCQDMKQRRPDMVFGADLIAGFPTEDDIMFENSLDLIDHCDLTYLKVFPFSPRPETAAARMKPVAPATIQERTNLLRAKGNQKRAIFLNGKIGSMESILVEGKRLGRTEQFASVQFAQDVKPGAIIKAVITSAGATHLEARIGL